MKKLDLNTLTHDELLDRYAKVAINVGLRPEPNQQIVLTAPLEARELVLKIAKHAYERGASVVYPLYEDDALTLTRYKHARDDAFNHAPAWLYTGMDQAFKAGAARLAIKGGNPSLLSGQDPVRVGNANKALSQASRPAYEEITKFSINWSLLNYVTPGWAKAVFPELSEEEAVKKLWHAVFRASRIDCEDPVANWTEHNANLHRRVELLNDKRFHELHFKGPNTDLHVGLANQHLWCGGSERAGNGVWANPNIPTEEVYTTPHRLRTNGIVTSTRPLSYGGTLIRDIVAEFKDGKIVKVSASEGQAVLEKMLATDDDASRLGEVALVPNSSPISQEGIIFQNTLFDENASCHIAQGECYPTCVIGGTEMTKELLTAHGGNHSLIHVDWMIGGPEMNVDGVYESGEVVPVMRKGEFVLGA
jgi:aminopeptidase